MIDNLTNEQIACLNSWPETVIGHAKDKLLIEEMNKLCIKFGYGRISQLAQGLEEIWRNPEEGGKKWQDFHDERMELIKGTIEHYNEDRV